MLILKRFRKEVKMMDEKLLYSICEKAKKYDELAKFNRDFEVHCTFCGKSQSAAKKIITSSKANICDECIELCYEIIHEENTESETTSE
jgi:hypothetical protein